MGFSSAIKEQVMLDAARYCCVCRKYKGVKIEVHHLEQEADGGPNTYENAIALCFDCHSDAGHYNDRHPKGTKFSIPELRKARDDWYQYVKCNPIVEKLIISEHIHTSYYVLHSFDVLVSAIKGEFALINTNRRKVYLSNNSISQKWKTLLESHTKEFGSNIEQQMLIEVQHFNSIEEYNNTYEGVRITDKSSIEYPYYEASRKLKWADLLIMLQHNLFISQLSESGIEAEVFCTSVLYKNSEGCGDVDTNFKYTEYLEFAPMSFVFLGITNVSKEQLKLNRLVTKEELSIALPNFNLLPSEMVLIPIATAINLQEIDKNSFVLNHIDGERGVDLSRVLSCNGFNGENVTFFNEGISPNSIIYNNNEGEYCVEIHKFDFNNLYSINSYWQCGSCPHLFFKKENGQQQYIRELLSTASFNRGFDSFIIPSNIFEIIIRELEDEVTYIDKIRINNSLIHENLILKQGESLKLKVSPNDIITIEGRYEPNFPSIPKLNDIWRRNEIVKQSNEVFNFKQNI